jgi:hypothetical protein
MTGSNRFQDWPGEIRAFLFEIFVQSRAGDEGAKKGRRKEPEDKDEDAAED